MDQQVHTPGTYDFRQYDRVWQRVAPALEPFAGEEAPAQGETLPAPQVRQEETLPGAEPNPCCMGSEAASMLEVLTGFIEEELEDRRNYLVLARQAPMWARQRLRELASDEGGHARKLMAAHYLITGTCYHPRVSCGQPCPGPWCEALRRSYHGEACGGFNYARAAEGTADICLAALFRELSDDEYRHAGLLMSMLERSVCGG